MRALPFVPILLLFAAPALAFDDTAKVSGNPEVYDGPGYNYPITGRLPSGAIVTLEQCTPDNGTPFPGYPRRHHDGDWCLVRGAGWVDASSVLGERARLNVTPPTSLSSPPSELFDDSPVLDSLDSDFFAPKPAAQ